MRFHIFFAFHTLFRRGRISARVLLSISGIALGVLVLVLTLGIMDGYRSQIRNLLSAAFAPIQVITTQKELALPKELRESVAIREAWYGQALILPCSGSSGRFINIKAVRGSKGFTPGDGIAGILDLEPGSCVRLLFSSGNARPKVVALKVQKVVSFGMESLDEGWAVVGSDLLPRMSGRHLFEVTPNDPSQTAALTEALGEGIGPDDDIITLKEANEDLFNTLLFQEWIMAVVLGLITGIAGIFFLARLLMDLEERRRTIGVLRTLGITGNDVTFIFFLYGLMVGFMGVIAGLAGGILLGSLVNVTPLLHFHGSLATVYGVDSIPIAIRPLHALGIALFAMAVVLFASLIPAFKSRRTQVIDALRYE